MCVCEREREREKERERESLSLPQGPLLLYFCTSLQHNVTVPCRHGPTHLVSPGGRYSGVSRLLTARLSFFFLPVADVVRFTYSLFATLFSFFFWWWQVSYAYSLVANSPCRREKRTSACLVQEGFKWYFTTLQHNASTLISFFITFGTLC